MPPQYPLSSSPQWQAQPVIQTHFLGRAIAQRPVLFDERLFERGMVKRRQKNRLERMAKCRERQLAH
jgi:hypothetical protein